ncbi:MAG: riboflavin kinase [bacterium]
MIFKSRQIRGAGRGKGIGFPTINLTIPDSLVLDDGIYASWVEIEGKPYKGALHYGPTPTFNQKENTLEVYLLDITDDNFPETVDKDITIDIVEILRGVERFETTDALVEQIARDVEKTRLILG